MSGSPHFLSKNFERLQKLWCGWDHYSHGPHGGRQMILSPTLTWRNRFVASLPRLCNCAIRKSALRTFSRNIKRNLQNTQTAPIAVVCTPTLKLGHRITKKNNVYLNFSMILFLSPSVSVPNRILLRYSLRVSEFCYAFVRKRTTISKNVSVCVFCVFCVYLSRRGVHLYLSRAPLSW